MIRLFLQKLLHHRHLTWALLLSTLVFGLISYRTLPVQLFPDTSPPLVNVITAYPGAIASDVARQLSRPLEEEFASLEGIVKIRSNSEDNLSIITLEFDYRRDSELAAMDVQNAIARIGDVLPDDIRQPQVLSFDSSDGAVITFGVVGNDPAEARRFAEDIMAPRLQRLPGVAAVDVFGGLRDALIVEADLSRIKALGLSLEHIRSEIDRRNTTRPAGRIETESTQTLFRVETRPNTPEELADTPISLADGSRVLLSEIADVRLSHLDEEAGFAINAVPAVALQVFKTDQANTVDLVRRAEAAALSMQAEWALFSTSPETARILVGDESASFTETSINNLFSNVAQAIFLAALLIFLFLGRPGASFVAAVSMPLSYGLTFIGMKLFGVEFNMVTLSAVILAVGMVVDASVVVLENIIRFREDHAEPEEAAVDGAADVAPAVLAGAATTTAVLIPLLFVPGFVGATFGPLALTLLLAFLSSLFVALVLIPPLSLFIPKSSSQKEFSTKITAPFRGAMNLLRNLFLFLLRRAFHQRTLTLLLALATFIFGIVGIKSRGMEVLPKMDGGSFFISYETPSGSSLAATNAVAAQIESILADETEVIKIQRQTGYERGMRSFSATGAQGPAQGFITVSLSPRTEREESIWSIQNRVRERIATIPDIEAAVVRELGNTAKSTTDAPLGIRLSGPDPLVLDKLADQILPILGAVDGVVSPVRNWRIDNPIQRVQVDSLRAAQLGISPQEVAFQMHAGSEGLPAGDFYGSRPGSIPLLLRYEQRHSPSDLFSIPLFLPSSGENIPLRTLAALSQELGPALATRENLVETLDITAQTSGRPLNFIIADVEEAMAEILLPLGYELELSGERSDLDEARSGLGQALLIAIGAVYLLLLIQLRSFSLPLVIMISVPLSLVGVSTALGIAAEPVSMPVMVGLILLVGIVVNNAIILLDVVSRFRTAGASRQEALLAAVSLRFRPIMMTSLSTVVGMIPLAAAWALGAERFSPLAIALMGGMIASTLLTLIIIPVLYDLIDGLSEKIKLMLTPKPSSHS